MRVRVSYTVDVDDDFRREIRKFYGLSGLATQQDVRDWFRAYGESLNEDIAAGMSETMTDPLPEFDHEQAMGRKP